jgi:hypothetical protein
MNARSVVNMADPASWPLGPVLALARGNPLGGFGELGFLARGHGATVYVGSIMDLEAGPLEPQLPRFKVRAYKDFASLSRAGWKVD